MRGETGIDDTTIFLPSSREASALGNVVVGHPLKFKFTSSALLPPFESSTKVSPYISLLLPPFANSYFKPESKGGGRQRD